MGNRTTIHEVGEGGSSRRRQGRSLRAVCGGPDPGAGHRPAACEAPGPELCASITCMIRHYAVVRGKGEAVGPCGILSDVARERALAWTSAGCRVMRELRSWFWSFG